MLLKDLLSNDVVNKLEKINNKQNGKKKKSKKNNKANKVNINKKDEKVKEPQKTVKKEKAKKVKTYEERYCKEYVEKKRYIEECPYCACTDLEITSNGYYYCCSCGFNVEKR